MRRYAENTEVTPDRSRAEIEKILVRYGATGFAYDWEGNRAMVGFQLRGRRFKVMVDLPPQNKFATTESGRRRTSKSAIYDAWEQEVRRRWRVLSLKIKADLEADEAGVVSIEYSWQPFTVLPNGTTTGDWMEGQIRDAYMTGEMPPLLPG